MKVVVVFVVVMEAIAYVLLTLMNAVYRDE